MADLSLTGGTIVTPEGLKAADVVISGDVISDLPVHFSGSANRTLDCNGLYILPGCIDVHVHFRTPGQEYKEDWETGSKAALAGGVTIVFDMPNNDPPIVDRAGLNAKHALIRDKALVNYQLYIGATDSNIDELKSVVGVCGIKMYMGSSTGNLLLADKTKLEEIFVYVADKIFCVHAESQALLLSNGFGSDPSIHSRLRPVEAAVDALNFVLDLSEKYSRRVHICHVSSAAEVEILRRRKTDLISCEVTPHHLFLDESCYARLGNFAKVNPPLRTLTDRKALFDALKDGVIDMLATDHAPHTVEEKNKPYVEAPSGMPGLETMLPLLLNEVVQDRLRLEQVVAVTSFNPARRFGLGDKGVIRVGNKADLVIVNMQAKTRVDNKKLYTKCGWSAFDGWELDGGVVGTVAGGKLRYMNGIFV